MINEPLIYLKRIIAKLSCFDVNSIKCDSNFEGGKLGAYFGRFVMSGRFDLFFFENGVKYDDSIIMYAEIREIDLGVGGNKIIENMNIFDESKNAIYIVNKNEDVGRDLWEVVRFFMRCSPSAQLREK